MAMSEAAPEEARPRPASGGGASSSGCGEARHRASPAPGEGARGESRFGFEHPMYQEDAFRMFGFK